MWFKKKQPVTPAPDDNRYRAVVRVVYDPKGDNRILDPDDPEKVYWVEVLVESLDQSEWVRGEGFSKSSHAEIHAARIARYPLYFNPRGDVIYA